MHACYITRVAGPSRCSLACDAASFSTREAAREGDMGACRLLLLLAAWAATPLMAGAQSEVPRIQGSWKIVYKVRHLARACALESACAQPSCFGCAHTSVARLLP